MEEVIVKGENGTRVSFDKWDDERAVWLYVSHKQGCTTCVIPRDQAELLLESLQNILKKETA